jgi:polygalacturonase
MKPFRLCLLSLLACAASAFTARAATPAAPQKDAYLFAYFYVNGEDGLHLAASDDGYKFELLGGDRSYLRPTVGEQKIMRDPCLFRGPDGTFHLVWTTSWAGKTLGYASSKDLITWSAQKEIPVMAHEAQAQNVWAPEITFDPVKQEYVIFWSTTILGKFRETENTNRRPERNHRIYAVTTKDFETFSPAKLYYDGGFNVIDATLAPNGSEWLMFVKNEQLTPKTEKNIRMVRAKTINGPFSEPSAPISGSAYWAEGPSAVKVGDEWRVYFDKHQEGKYGAAVTRDLQTWTDVSEKVSLPTDARHGTVIAVSSDVIDNLRRNAPSAGAAKAGTYNVLDYGAAGDGIAKETGAINRAIKAVERAGGGTVYFPAGKYLTGSIHMVDNLTLHLEAGAELLYSGDPADSALVESRWEGTSTFTHGPLIYANGKQNIAITGRGIINGVGKNWWWRTTEGSPGPKRDQAMIAKTEWREKIYPRVHKEGKLAKEDYKLSAEFTRPSLVVFFECQNIRVEGVTLTMSPMWLMHAIYSEDINVTGVRFVSEHGGPNGDGFDIDSCRNVRVSDCFFHTGDDCIVIKSGKDDDGRRVARPTEFVTITNCVFYAGHGAVVIGSETSGGINNIVASNNVCKGTDRGIRIKTMRGRGSVIQNVRFDNWVIEDSPREAIHITANYVKIPEEPKSERTPVLRNISISNITVVNAKQVVGIAGLPEQSIENVRMTDITGDGEIGFVADRVDGLELRDIRVDAKTGPAFTFTNAKRLFLDTLSSLESPDRSPTVKIENVPADSIISRGFTAK